MTEENKPTFDEIFNVMASASVGNMLVRVEVPEEPDLEDIPTKIGLALNILLDDLALHVATRQAFVTILSRNASRNALALFLLLLCLVAGFTGLVTIIVSGTLVLSTVLWNFGLLAGSSISIAGIYWKDRVTGRLIERAGLIAIGFAALAYSITLYRDIDNIIVTSAFGLFALYRAYQTGKEAKLEAFLYEAEK